MDPITKKARNKSAIYLGIVAVAAIIIGLIIYNHSDFSQPDDNTLSPALNLSKERAKTTTPAKTTKAPAPKSK